LRRRWVREKKTRPGGRAPAATTTAPPAPAAHRTAPPPLRPPMFRVLPAFWSGGAHRPLIEATADSRPHSCAIRACPLSTPAPTTQRSSWSCDEVTSDRSVRRATLPSLDTAFAGQRTLGPGLLAWPGPGGVVPSGPGAEQRSWLYAPHTSGCWPPSSPVECLWLCRHRHRRSDGELSGGAVTETDMNRSESCPSVLKPIWSRHDITSEQSAARGGRGARQPQQIRVSGFA
jgi:hypothetical protein